MDGENISKELICLGVLQEPANSKVMFTNIAFNIVFSIIATLENLLVAITLWRSSNLQSPSNTLLYGLALSDLFNGLICEPFVIAWQVAVYNNKLTSCILPTIKTTLFAVITEVALFTVTAISIDRYLAIHFHLRYAEVITKKRVKIALLCFLLISGLHSVTLIFGFASFFHQVMVVIGTICLLAVSFSWIKVYQVMQRHQAHIQVNMIAPGHQFNMARFRKTAKNTIIILFIFVSCYLPYFTAAVIFAFKIYSPTYMLVLIIHSVIFFNSSLNPFLYCWRYGDIRAAAKQTLIKLCFRDRMPVREVRPDAQQSHPAH